MGEDMYTTWEKYKAGLAEKERRHAARPVVIRKSIDAWWWIRYRLLGRHGIIRYKLSPRRRARQVRWFIQRGRRGWADCDLWTFDTYLTVVMAQGLVSLAGNFHGYPGVEPFNTPEKWEAHLRELAAGLIAWKTVADDSETWSYEAEQAAYRRSGEAIAEFGKHFGIYFD